MAEIINGRSEIIDLEAVKADSKTKVPPGWSQHPVQVDQFVKTQGAIGFQVTRNPPMPPNIPASARPKAALTLMNLAENKAVTTYHGSDIEAFAYADMVMGAASYSQIITSGMPKQTADEILQTIDVAEKSGLVPGYDFHRLRAVVTAMVQPEVSDEKTLDTDSNPE